MKYLFIPNEGLFDAETVAKMTGKSISKTKRQLLALCRNGVLYQVISGTGSTDVFNGNSTPSWVMKYTRRSSEIGKELSNIDRPPKYGYRY